MRAHRLLFSYNCRLYGLVRNSNARLDDGVVEEKRFDCNGLIVGFCNERQLIVYCFFAGT